MIKHEHVRCDTDVSVIVSDSMTGGVLPGVLLLLHAVLAKWEAPFHTLGVVNNREARGLCVGGGAISLQTGRLGRHGKKQAFEALLSHQARLITRKIDLWRFFNALGTPRWFAWQLPAEGLDFNDAGEWCWCDVNVSKTVLTSLKIQIELL